MVLLIPGVGYLFDVRWIFDYVETDLKQIDRERLARLNELNSWGYSSLETDNELNC